MKRSELTAAIVEKVLQAIGGDGHTIWKASAFDGIPVGLWARFLRRIESDPTSMKGELQDTEGRPVEALEGVHGLMVLRAVYGMVSDEVPKVKEWPMGRGTEAQMLTKILDGWIQTQQAKDEEQTI